MDVEKLSMEPAQAKLLYDEYQKHRDGMDKNDQAIASIYKRIAQGKLVIRALASITAAGVFADSKLPKLAIARADQRKVHARPSNGFITFSGMDRYGREGRMVERNIKVAMPGMDWNVKRRVADVPLIPVHLRPRKAIDKYFVLWEADWDQYPVDPYLLRRCGADAWIVCAHWNLSPVERAVMSQSLNG